MVLKRKNSLLLGRLSPPRILVLGFALIILMGAVLLSLPAAHTNRLPFPFIDALFTAVSATCVTGLVVVDTGTHFSIFGQIVILSLIQIGGLGFMTMATLVAMALKKRITLRERLILQESMNQSNIEGIVRLIRKVILYSLLIEAAGALLFALRWSFDMPLGKALYYGMFHSISMFNNAGFDLFGEFRSLTGYADDWMVNGIAMGLIVLGGLGFIVMSDLLQLRKSRRLSLHSKVVLSYTGILIVVGAVVFFIIELTNPRTLGTLSWDGKILASFFQSVTPRTAGANTLDIAGLRQASQFFTVILMFIGASPGSTGGGIKTTTFATLLGAMIAIMRGKEDVVMFRFRLAKERVYKAVTMTLFAMLLVLLMSMLLATTEDHHFLMILFEVTSAFSTVGLSMGLTPQLTLFGKLIIMLLMFMGRVGPLTMAYAIGPGSKKELYRYPEGTIILG
jgi:trk system potassium uptake protein